MAVLVLAVLGAALLLWQRPWQDDPSPRAAPVDADVAAALTQQVADLSDASSQAELTRAAGDGPAGRAFAAAAWPAREALGASQVTMRYVSGGDVPEHENGDTEATVELDWPDRAITDTSLIKLRLRPQDDGGFDVVSASPGSGAVPVWLAGRVSVQRDGEVTVLDVAGLDQDRDVEAERTVQELADSARRQVTRVVPGTTGRLVVVSAPSGEVASAVLGRRPGALDQIAAVSTRLDGRQGSLIDGDVVVTNPTVFDTMDARASQIVMTHEATHVLTGAVGRGAATWVVEGFADFVALHDDDAPLRVSAGQALAGVLRDGAPTALPTAQDFDESTHGLGAVYESVWLAFRMLAADEGDARVVAFYRDVIAGQPVDQAARSTLDLDTAQITARWRAYLTKSASTVS